MEVNRVRKLELTYSDVVDDVKDFYMNTFANSIRNLYGLEININTDLALNNKSKLISDDEILEIIELLHPDYQNLKMKINIHRNRFSILLSLMNPTLSSGKRDGLLEGYRSEIAGFQREREIVMFPHIYERKLKNQRNRNGCFKLLLIGAVLHEIRHVWQMKHKKEKYWKAHDSYINAGAKGYNSQWIERDANAFTQRTMNNNKDKINEILGVEFDWDCIWGSYNIK